MTLGEYLLGKWLPAQEATLAPSTQARNVTCVEHYLLPHLGDTPLRRLQTEHFEALYRRLAVTGSRRGGPLAAIGYRLEFSRLKTRTSRRNVTVDVDTLALLADWRRSQRTALAAARVVNEHGLVFTRPDGKPLHPHSVSQAFDRAQRRLDVSPIRCHDLRHTHASLLLRDKVPIKVVSERLGHSNPAFHDDDLPVEKPAWRMSPLAWWGSGPPEAEPPA